MSLFRNQTLLYIEIDCGTDVTIADLAHILYSKPDGTQGLWIPQLIGTTLKYDFVEGDIDQSGNWQFQGYVEITGRKAYTDIITKTFLEPIYIPLIP
jgi:hypothetical protein